MEPWEWSPGIPPLSQPTQSPSPPPKIKYNVKDKEHRILTHPCVIKYWRLDIFFKKEKKSSLQVFYGKNHNDPPYEYLTTPDSAAKQEAKK